VVSTSGRVIKRIKEAAAGRERLLFIREDAEMKKALSVLALAFAAGCSTPPIKPQAYPTAEQIEPVPTEVQVTAPAAHAVGGALQASTVAARPAFCYADPGPYLEEVERIYRETAATIESWNRSSRREQELLLAEIRIRALASRVDALDPPEDYRNVQGHLSDAMKLNLYALFGVTDRRDEHREGSNTGYREEFQMAQEAWEDAYQIRLTVCE
jgi:hypothetical protein